MFRISQHYNFLSVVYDALDWPFEKFRYPRLRRMMCGDLKGRVLEAGVGTGKNLGYYPQEANVTGVDLSRGMLDRAAERARRARCRVELRVMDVTRLPFADRTFDACVASYMLCVMPDEQQASALKEMLRVTRPGGEVRILEHRYSRRWWRRMMQKAYSPYVRCFFHSRYDHSIADAVSVCGAKMVSERYVVSDVEKMYILKSGRNGRSANISGI